MIGEYQSYNLQFKFRAGTSRGYLQEKPTYFIKIEDKKTNKIGIGECSPLWGLSIDDKDSYKGKILKVLSALKNTRTPESVEEAYSVSKEIVGLKYPSIRFGLETAFLSILSNDFSRIFTSPILDGVPLAINGLVWMSDVEQMRKQAVEKIEMGYKCIKIKIGAIDPDIELKFLTELRNQFQDIIIRVDANGAFNPDNVNGILKTLANLRVHSIEQPIKAGEFDEMARLCSESPLPIALDEELIGSSNKKTLLSLIKPAFIVLKPSLLGGFDETKEWIETAKGLNIGWWITSALESNIGLNAIAQFTSYNDNGMIHGLGTGQLYHNNIESPLVIREGQLYYDESRSWNLEYLSKLSLNP